MLTYYRYRRGTYQERPFLLTGKGDGPQNKPPMQVRYALFSDYALVTADNKVCIIGIFDTIRAPALPHQHPLMFITVGILAEYGEDRQCRLEVLLWDPDGQPLFTRQVDVTFRPPEDVGGVATHNEMMGIGGALFQQAGPHGLIVRINGQQVQRVNLMVTQVAPIPSEGAPPSP